MYSENSQRNQKVLANQNIGPFRTKRLFLIIMLFLLAVFPAEIGEYTRAALEDAYIGVSVFVAMTLAFFYFAEKISGNNISELFKKAKFAQVPLASFMGALPGCGGAIMVITQYVRGKLSFGSVMATLTATMGDAAFLLIAKKPLVGFAMLVVGFIVGLVSGILVNKIHGPDFMRDKKSLSIKLPEKKEFYHSSKLDVFWIALFLPGIILGIFTAFQFDLDTYFSRFYVDGLATLFGFFAGSLCFFMWLWSFIGGFKPKMSSPNETITRRTVSDTNFVTGWVIIAFLCFELTVYLVDLDLKLLFSDILYFVPLIAVLIGFLPGCGPQLLVTTMFIAGFLPLSAQIGNAISNDGDALFPALAISPKVALVATIYSAIPALIVSYGYLIFFEL